MGASCGERAAVRRLAGISARSAWAPAAPSGEREPAAAVRATPKAAAAAREGAAGEGAAGEGATTGMRSTFDHGSFETSTTSGASMNFPSNFGSIAMILAASGGWVAQRPPKFDSKACAKKKWLISAARWVSSDEPIARPPIFFSGRVTPSGFRVNWTAEASARNSLCRDTEAWISRPKK